MPTAPAAEEKRPRTRTSRKRLHFRKWPVPALPVRALWEAASEAEQQRAHQVCIGILECWLGRSKREEVASRLEMSRLRLWQLSQQALGGMAAGLLKQPRSRPRQAPQVLTDPENDPKTLRKKLTDLERRYRTLEELVTLLRELPGSREMAKAKGREDGDGKKPQEEKRRGGARGLGAASPRGGGTVADTASTPAAG
jgi:hypothetical protein